MHHDVGNVRYVCRQHEDRLEVRAANGIVGSIVDNSVDKTQSQRRQGRHQKLVGKWKLKYRNKIEVRFNHNWIGVNLLVTDHGSILDNN